MAASQINKTVYSFKVDATPQDNGTPSLAIESVKIATTQYTDKHPIPIDTNNEAPTLNRTLTLTNKPKKEYQSLLACTHLLFHFNAHPPQWLATLRLSLIPFIASVFSSITATLACLSIYTTNALLPTTLTFLSATSFWYIIPIIAIITFIAATISVMFFSSQADSYRYYDNENTFYALATLLGAVVTALLTVVTYWTFESLLGLAFPLLSSWHILIPITIIFLLSAAYFYILLNCRQDRFAFAALGLIIDMFLLPYQLCKNFYIFLTNIKIDQENNKMIDLFNGIKTLTDPPDQQSSQPSDNYKPNYWLFDEMAVEMFNHINTSTIANLNATRLFILEAVFKKSKIDNDCQTEIESMITISYIMLFMQHPVEEDNNHQVDIDFSKKRNVSCIANIICEFINNKESNAAKDDKNSLTQAIKLSTYILQSLILPDSNDYNYSDGDCAISLTVAQYMCALFPQSSRIV